MSDSSSGEEDVVQPVRTTKAKSTKQAKSAEHKQGIADDEEEHASTTEEAVSFEQLGITPVLCETCTRLGWQNPTNIQALALPAALAGRDIIGLAETGSGKTGAFALPILQALLEHTQKFFALVLTPTRELAFQIGAQFESLGSGIGLLVAVIVGGIDMTTQALALAKGPHIIVATPGRLVDHLENTKGFSLRALKYLVMDEADRILNMDFEVELDKILKVIPRDRRTYLFSATMTKKVAKLERASLRDPIRVELNSRYKTVDKLAQHYIFMPQKYKEAYLVHVLNDLPGKSVIVFTSTCQAAMLTAHLLRQLGMAAVPLHGQMSQQKRLGALNSFTTRSRDILVCTDVASRGLDIPHVDVVLNFDVPGAAKDYVHRVGRTARAGRAGLAVTFVTQYDVELYQRIELHLEKKLTAYECPEQDVMTLVERTSEALSAAKEELREQEQRKRSKRRHNDSDDDASNARSKGAKRKTGKIKNML